MMKLWTQQRSQREHYLCYTHTHTHTSGVMLPGQSSVGLCSGYQRRLIAQLELRGNVCVCVCVCDRITGWIRTRGGGGALSHLCPWKKNQFIAFCTWTKKNKKEARWLGGEKRGRGPETRADSQRGGAYRLHAQSRTGRKKIYININIYTHILLLLLLLL